MNWFDTWIFDCARYEQMRTVGHNAFQSATLAVSMPFLIFLSVIAGILCGQLILSA